MADFKEHQAEFDALDVRIIAISSDSEENARVTAEHVGPAIKVGYGVDAAETSRIIGCYTGVHEGLPHVQPASFILNEKGLIALAVYSSGKVGRLTAKDALTLANDLRTKRESGATRQS